MTRKKSVSSLTDSAPAPDRGVLSFPALMRWAPSYPGLAERLRTVGRVNNTTCNEPTASLLRPGTGCPRSGEAVVLIHVVEVRIRDHQMRVVGRRRSNVVARAIDVDMLLVDA